MARASYQHIPNLVLGHLHESRDKAPKQVKRTAKGAKFTPIKTTYTPTPREKKPILTLKF